MKNILMDLIPSKNVKIWMKSLFCPSTYNLMPIISLKNRKKTIDLQTKCVYMETEYESMK